MKNKDKNKANKKENPPDLIFNTIGQQENMKQIDALVRRMITENNVLKKY
ncbi:MAG: hypothetical protein ABJJ25_00675 [Eudoraea sp.]